MQNLIIFPRDGLPFDALADLEGGQDQSSGCVAEGIISRFVVEKCEKNHIFLR